MTTPLKNEFLSLYGLSDTKKVSCIDKHDDTATICQDNFLRIHLHF
jgi:hypothetical protein